MERPRAGSLPIKLVQSVLTRHGSDDQQRTFGIIGKLQNRRPVLTKFPENRLCVAVSHTQTDYLRRRSIEEAHLMEVTVLADDCESILCRVPPDIFIVGALQSAFPDMGASWEFRGK